MTATAVLFPGLNTVFRDKDRRRFDTLTQVQDNFSQLEKFGFADDLDVSAQELISQGRYASVAAISMSIQCGVYRKLLQSGVEPNILVGCSLGDVPRSVCCGAVSFEEVLQTLASLRESLGALLPAGKTLAIRFSGPSPIDRTVITRLQAAGFEPSVLSSRHMTLGCETNDYDQVVSICEKYEWTVKDTAVPFPLHTRYLRSTVDSLWSQIDLTERAILTPAFSSVQLKRLNCWGEFLEDAHKVLYQPIQWPLTLELLRNKEGISKFINIGPCNSLILLARETDRSLSITPAAQHFLH